MERVHQKTDKEAPAQLAAALSQPGLRIVVCIEYIHNFFAHIWNIRPPEKFDNLYSSSDFRYIFEIW